MSLNIIYEKKYMDIYADSTKIRPNRKLTSPPHIHRDLELVLYYGGKTDAYSDSICYHLQAGDIFLTFPNQIHSYQTHTPEDMMIIIVKPELMPELADIFDMKIPVSAVIPNVANEPTIKTLAERVVSLTTRRDNIGQPYTKSSLRGYLLALFSEIVSRMPIKGVSVEDSDALRSIVSYCSRNFSSNLSLSVLEENLHLNKFYISHLFSERLGLRFNDYINSLRISEACRYLLNSTHSVTEISDLVGFNTMRTFNRAFRRQIGTTPFEYRKINGKASKSNA